MCVLEGGKADAKIMFLSWPVLDPDLHLGWLSQQACGEIDIHPTERLIIVHLALHRALFSHSYLLFNQTQEVKSRLRESESTEKVPDCGKMSGKMGESLEKDSAQTLGLGSIVRRNLSFTSCMCTD